MLIGLVGSKGVGKNTFANKLVNSYNFIQKSMADPLKKACQCLFLFTDDQVNGTIEQKETPDPRWFNCTPRLALQFVGTELLRDNLNKIMPGIDKNVFIHHLKIWYDEAIKSNPKIKVVISDIRFQNEAKFIKDSGGILIRIIRSNNQSKDEHSSEMELQSIECDYIINNNSTLSEFLNKIDVLMNGL